MVKKRPKTGGRKPGSIANEHDIVDVVKSQCMKCLSTDRSRYHKKRAEKLPPNHSRRPMFTHLIFRSCKCAKCGQWRWDKTYENSEGWPGMVDCDDDDE